MPTSIDFDPIFVAEDTTPDEVSISCRQVNDELTIIGHCEDRDLLMGQSGSVYGDYSGILYYVGASGEEAIEALITGKLIGIVNKPSS